MSSIFSAIEPITPISFDKVSPVKPAAGDGASAVPFADVLKDAVSNYTDIKAVTDTESQNLALGNVDNLAQLQIDSMKAQAALSTTVQLTSRVVTAYKEIMQMQV